MHSIRKQDAENRSLSNKIQKEKAVSAGHIRTAGHGFCDLIPR